jgi:hypothetical protein
MSIRTIRSCSCACARKRRPVDFALQRNKPPEGRGLDGSREALYIALTLTVWRFSRAPSQPKAHFRPVDQCEQRVVLADADVRAGMELGGPRWRTMIEPAESAGRRTPSRRASSVGSHGRSGWNRAFFCAMVQFSLRGRLRRSTALISISVKFWR